METKRTNTLSEKEAERKRELLAPKKKIQKSVDNFPVYYKPREETEAKILARQTRLLECQLSLSSTILAQEGKSLVEACEKKDMLIANLREEAETMGLIAFCDEEKDPYREEIEKLKAKCKELAEQLNIARNECAVKDGEIKGYKEKELGVVEAMKVEFSLEVEKFKAVCSKLAEETRVLRNECVKKDGEIKGMKDRERVVVEGLAAEFQWEHRKLVKELDIARKKCAVKDGEIKGPNEGELGVPEVLMAEFREEMEKLKVECGKLAEDSRVLRNECAAKDGEIEGLKDRETMVVEALEAEFGGEMEKLKAECSRLAEESLVLRNECAVKDGEIEGLKDRETRVVKALRVDFREQERKIVRELAGSGIKCREIDGKLAVFQNKCARLEVEISELKVSQEKVSKECAELKRENLFLKEFCHREVTPRVVEENANQRVPVFPVEEQLEIFRTRAALEMGMEQERVQLVPEQLANPIERESTLVIAQSSCKLKRTRSIEDDENGARGGSSIPKKRSKLALVDIETCEVGIKFLGYALRSNQSRYNLRSTSRHNYNLRCRKSNLNPSK